MDELISVVIPVYKVEKYIRKSLDSVLNQTYKNLEVIIVDDGSPDNCPKIIDEYANKDNRIKVIHQKNGGLSNARNSGIKIATGEYIAFVDSDDTIRLDMYEILYNLAKKYNADISMCNLLNVSEDDNSNIIIPESKDEEVVENVFTKVEALRHVLLDDKIGNYVCTKFFKRKLFENVLFPDGKVYEDAATTYKLMDKAERVAYINLNLYYYLYGRVGAITTTFTKNKIYDSLYASYNKYMFLITNYPELKKEASLSWTKIYTSAMEKICMNNYEDVWEDNTVIEKYPSFKIAFDTLDIDFMTKYLEPYRIISSVLLRHSRKTYKEMFPVIYNNIKGK